MSTRKTGVEISTSRKRCRLQPIRYLYKQLFNLSVTGLRCSRCLPCRMLDSTCWILDIVLRSRRLLPRMRITSIVQVSLRTKHSDGVLEALRCVCTQVNSSRTLFALFRNDWQTFYDCCFILPRDSGPNDLREISSKNDSKTIFNSLEICLLVSLNDDCKNHEIKSPTVVT